MAWNKKCAINNEKYIGKSVLVIANVTQHSFSLDLEEWMVVEIVAIKKIMERFLIQQDRILLWFTEKMHISKTSIAI